MFRFEFQKLWIIYLVTSSSLFTLPPPVFSQHQSVYLRSFASQNSTSSDGPTGDSGPSGPSGSDGDQNHDGEGGAEPIQSGSSPRLEESLLTGPEGDNVEPSETLRRFRSRRPPPKGRPSRPHLPRRHPHPRPHGKSPSEPGPREKPILIKPSKLNKSKLKSLLSVPKLRGNSMFERFRKHHPPPPQRHQETREEREREFNRGPPSPRVPITRPPPTPPSISESLETSAGSSIEMKMPPNILIHGPDPHDHDHHHDTRDHRPDTRNHHDTRNQHHHDNRGHHHDTRGHHDTPDHHHRRPPLKELSQSILEQLFPSSPDSSSLSDEKARDNKAHDPKNSPRPSSSSSSLSQASFFNGERPAEGYIVTDDKRELDDLWANHHLRRRKECDGLENFVYDMEIISFLLGVVAALFGMYSDVIPFFNDGVKINYNNDYLGDGVDFPHDYWPKHDTKIDARTISIGTNQDHMREVMSVTGEFVGLLGLAISFLALFPSLVEKFFYSLDWWFGKRGLWKQYLYTYKCEVHPYPQPGWGKTG